MSKIQSRTSAAVAVPTMSAAQLKNMQSSKRLGAVASGFARAAAREKGASIRDSYKAKPTLSRGKSQRGRPSVSLVDL